jgi:hypothetical protein
LQNVAIKRHQSLMRGSVDLCSQLCRQPNHA